MTETRITAPTVPSRDEWEDTSYAPGTLTFCTDIDGQYITFQAFREGDKHYLSAYLEDWVKIKITLPNKQADFVRVAQDILNDLSEVLADKSLTAREYRAKVVACLEKYTLNPPAEG